MPIDSSFITKQDKRGVKNEYIGLYAGVVEYVSDPLNLGRIKVRVAGINDADASRTPPQNLVWCLPCFTPGTFIVPDVGETVWVLFQRGQVDYPVYLGTWPGITDTKRVKGRLPVLSMPEPVGESPIVNSTQQTVNNVQGDGLPGDFLFQASGDQEALGSNAQLAQQILTNSNVTLATVHPSGVQDGATARQNIQDTANGGAAQRSAYQNAPGGAVVLSTALLNGILGVAKTFKIAISEIAGGSHSANSRHYLGVAVDITSINGVPVSYNNPLVTSLMGLLRTLGATEVLGPGDEGHTTHVHGAWPRTGGGVVAGARYTIQSRTDKLAVFASSAAVQVTGSKLNNGIFTVLAGNSLVDGGSELTVSGPLQYEDASTATIGELLTPARANNTKSYIEPAGNEAPAESYSRKQSVDPTVRVLAKSPKGHTIYSIDDDGHEKLVIVDRAGAQLFFSNPVADETADRAPLNKHNAVRRVLGEAASETALPVNALVGETGTVGLIDILGQFLKLITSGKGSSIAELHGVPNDSGFIRIQQDGNLITIRSDRDSDIKIDESIVANASSDARMELRNTGQAKLSSQRGAYLDLDVSGNATLSTPVGTTITITNGLGKIVISPDGILIDNGLTASINLIGPSIIMTGTPILEN